MEAITEVINFLTDPKLMMPGAAILFLLAIRTRQIWTNRVGLIALIVSVVFFIISFQDPNFRIIVTKGDNIPIVMLLYFAGFFVWFSLKQGYDNDDRIARGEGPIEKQEYEEKVLTWPHLVYIELIALTLATVGLIVWSILIKAPLEEPANPANTPNPSKAPWYFLGLQEMLVYYDPWIAGVVLPTLVIVGLMAIPYMDRNIKGAGYYTFRERKFAITMFLFGFLVLWVMMISIGTFLRGPNWNFFGPYEYWDLHKLAALVNVNLSEYIYVMWLGTGLPENWFLREVWGFVIVILFFALPPPIMARTVFKDFYRTMGFPRYSVLMLLFLFMVSLPAKMLLRWLFNLKYIVAIPEFFFNI
ncbi:MAG: hypothetical protein O7G87_11955 [bacterium]|nr:hypothetical protein [bacterium]